MDSSPPSLEAGEFAPFYHEIHGRKAHLWQERATRELAEGTVWPGLWAPTGSGKTTLIECFLFALACVSDKRPRPLPLRLYWVVDRRAVVDQVHLHARRVVARIRERPGDVAERVYARLRALGGELLGDDAAVQLRLWRGGLWGEADEELRRTLVPVAPAVICTTVDQVGSRLLFRGYGVSRKSRPVEAALAGTDSLIALDEAHLSEPFAQTVGAVASFQGSYAGPAEQVRLLSVSATPSQLPDGAFRLSERELAEPAIAKRFNAVKKTRLVRGSDRSRLLAREAERLAQEGARVIGVVANTVAIARAAFDRLRREGPALLVIGPSRPLERAPLLERVRPREERGECDEPLYVVGTQTLEVGVDLDFDSLVTECAPLPALVQRFGRLDRAGDLVNSHAVVVQPPRKCPVYGESTTDTWAWLQRTAADHELDLGPRSARDYQERGAPPGPPQPDAPLLGHWHVESLMQTSHDPVPAPEVGVFLHGERGLEVGDVQLAWRADLRRTAQGQDRPDEWTRRVRRRLPHPSELMPLSLPAVRRWLAARLDADMADVESLPLEQPSDANVEEPLSVVRVPSPDPDGRVRPEVVRPAAIRPGDVIVVPAEYGWCDEFGWAPDRNEPVTDLGNLDLRRPHVLIAPELTPPEEVLKAARTALELIARDELSEREAYGSVVDGVRAWFADGGSHHGDSAAASQAREVATRLAAAGRAAPSGQAADRGLILVPDRVHGRRAAARAIPYAQHRDDVEQRTIRFARTLGLDVRITESVRMAARYHDIGKLDRRFQAWLNGGTPGDPADPLAKSGTTGDFAAAREAAGWPEGRRHEVLSAALACRFPGWPPDVDRDVVLHLIATHHGDGRPFRKAVDDPDPVRVTVSMEGRAVEVLSDEEIPWSEHVHRFLELTDRFGPWGLAALESLLVLADRSVSREEAR